MRATERIAAVGDVVAGPALAHKATAEAAVAAEALSGRPAAFDARAIPVVIFTDPEIGSVGLSEAQAREAGLDRRGRHLPAGRLRAAPARWARARASPGSSPTPRPTASSACTSSARTPASSWPAAALAIELMAAPGDVAATIHPHPTLSEGLREAAELMLAAAVRCDSSELAWEASVQLWGTAQRLQLDAAARRGRRAALSRSLRPRSPTCAVSPARPWRRASARTTPDARG